MTHIAKTTTMVDFIWRSSFPKELSVGLMLAGRERYSDVQPPRAGCGLEATGLLSLSEVKSREEP